MCLLDLIEKNDRIRFPANSLRQLPSVVVSDISRRGSDQLTYGMCLHKLRHIHPDQRVFIRKHRFGNGFDQFRLPDTGRTDKNKRRRLMLLTESGTVATNCARQSVNRLILPDHTLMQAVFQLHQPLRFGFGNPLNRNSCPHLNDRSNIFLRNDSGNHLVFERRNLLLKAKKRGLGLRLFLVEILRFDLLRRGCLDTGLDRSLLRLLFVAFRQKLLVFNKTKFAKIGSRARLVKQIDRLIRQITIHDVA